MIGLVELFVVPVGAPDRKTGIGLAISVHSMVRRLDVSAKPPLASLNPHIDNFIGIQAQALSMRLGMFQRATAVPVIQEDGVGNPSLGLMIDPPRVVTVEFVLIGNTAAFSGRVIPLNVNALIPHILEHFPKERHI